MKFLRWMYGLQGSFSPWWGASTLQSLRFLDLTPPFRSSVQYLASECLHAHLLFLQNGGDNSVTLKSGRVG